MFFSRINGAGRLRRLLVNGALLLCAVAAGLVLLEFASARILAKPDRRNDPAFLNGELPRNSLGYRDFEYPTAKGADCFRILAVGDSFTQGVGVTFDDSYPKRLERFLNYFGKVEKTVYQVLNMGVPRRSTPEELQLIRKMAPKLAPDLVIIGYCLNDAEDWDNPAGVEALRRRFRQQLFEKPGGWPGALYERSNLVRLVTQRLFNSRTARGQRRYYNALYGETYPGWPKTRAALKELTAFSRENRVPVAVVIFPLFSFGLGPEYPFRHLHRQIHQVLKEAGIPYLDLLQVYRDLDRFRLEAVPYEDPHPSEIGHRIAGEAVFRFLLHERLVPSGRDFRRLKAEAPPSPF